MVRGEPKHSYFLENLDVVNGKAPLIVKDEEKEELDSNTEKVSSDLKSCGKLDPTKVINSCLRSSPSRSFHLQLLVSTKNVTS